MPEPPGPIEKQERRNDRSRCGALIGRASRRNEPKVVEWAWEELNFRPHAYQRPHMGFGLLQHAGFPSGRSATCRLSDAHMPPSAGLNRQQNRQQRFSQVDPGLGSAQVRPMRIPTT